MPSHRVAGRFLAGVVVCAALLTLAAVGASLAESFFLRRAQGGLVDSGTTYPECPADQPSGLGALNCKITAALGYLYDSAYGGRGSACTGDNGGHCWVGGGGKAALDADLAAGNLTSGTTIFGVTGTGNAGCLPNQCIKADGSCGNIRLHTDIFNWNGSQPNNFGGSHCCNSVYANSLPNTNYYSATGTPYAAPAGPKSADMLWFCI